MRSKVCLSNRVSFFGYLWILVSKLYSKNMSAMEEAEAVVSPMKVNELKENLKKRGLSTAGNKAALAERLRTAIVNEKNSEDSAHEGEPEQEETAEQQQQEEQVEG